jgi:hypothetical protein
MNKCHGQSYDGSGNASGVYSGVKLEELEENQAMNISIFSSSSKCF